MNSITKKDSGNTESSDSDTNINRKIRDVVVNTSQKNDEEIENLCDDNLNTIKKVHAILLNCSNLSKKQKLEFCESERYFMKLYLKKLSDKTD
ncbi:hypothetical protein LCGC14_2730960 [marine sediment metagenome]|uniref:Uncharacterized protein n=1 Tax=marine sediment metagenome TaxID=412755 RepID=A0A0F9BZ03_9ZZZZ